MPDRLIHDGEAPSLTMQDAHRVLDALGPMPGEALAAMVDYGLSDAEIARYYGLSSELVATLRAHWRIG
ncbi:MAG: hypothetical protein R6V26_14585 [Roseovarius sp.]